MTTLAIIGAQWGDEGKGKITDMLGQKADVVVRYQGGNNAGHTIIFGDNKIILHQIPSGILHKSCTAVIAHGVVFEPEAFFTELKDVEAHIKVTGENLKLSINATIITSYHKILDANREGKTKNKIGTTGKGIGPAYEDKVGRRAIKVKDLFDMEVLKTKLALSMEEKEYLFKDVYKVDYPTVEEEATRLYDFGQKLFQYACDTFSYLDQAEREDKNILYEGAQGILLDIDYGSYPYVTSSSTGAAGIHSGAGASSGKIDEKLGIAKAYTTRVGEGPFPTEIFEPIGETIQKIGKEFGATTGRRRRCGWLDLPLLKYAVKASGLTSIALTKVDILNGLDELQVCYAYEYEGREIDCAYPGIDLSKVKPLYKNLTPFNQEFNQTQEMSVELRDYVNLIEKELGVSVGILAFGPERDEIQFTQEYFQ